VPTRSPVETLRFLAAPTDVLFDGEDIVNGGRILEWIDKAAYAVAASWSGRYCVTAYVGHVSFRHGIPSGHLVEVEARIVYTGRSSMHIQCTVRHSDPKTLRWAEATNCLVIFVATDGQGHSVPVPEFDPITAKERAHAKGAVGRAEVRKEIEEEMARQAYTDAGTAPKVVTRFLAQPTDVNWGGKVHGGTAMEWIDQAAWLCASQWSGMTPTVVYSGGVRFYRPIQIGHVVELEARLLRTNRKTMDISVHVRSGDPRTDRRELTTHCAITYGVRDHDGRLADIPQWSPVSAEDQALAGHAHELRRIRGRRVPGLATG